MSDSAGDKAEHVIATYREIAAHFGLKGVVQARVKSKRAGWAAEPQNHPADPLHIRVPREVWNAGSRGAVPPLPRASPIPRNPSSPIPDIKEEIWGIVKGFEAILDTLREQQATLVRQLDRERERAEQAEAAREVARAETTAERSRAAHTEGELEGLKLATEHQHEELAQMRREVAEAHNRAVTAEQQAIEANRQREGAEAALARARKWSFLNFLFGREGKGRTK